MEKWNEHVEKVNAYSYGELQAVLVDLVHSLGHQEKWIGMDWYGLVYTGSNLSMKPTFFPDVSLLHWQHTQRKTSGAIVSFRFPLS